MAVEATLGQPWRLRAPWRDDRRRIRFGVAIVAAVLLHGLALLLLHGVAWVAPRPDPAPLRIELLRSSPRPALPALQPAQPAQPAPVHPAVPRTEAPPLQRPSLASAEPAPAQPRIAAPAPAAVAAPAPSPAAAPLSPRVAIYGRDGRLKVPAAVLEGPGAPVPSWIEPGRTPAPWDQRVDPLVYTPTALEPLWKPDGENLLQEFIRRNTRSRTFKLPDGTRVTCGWVLLMGGCSW